MWRKHSVPPVRLPAGSLVTESKRKPDGTVLTFACEYLAHAPGLAVILFHVPGTMRFTTLGTPPGNTRSLGFFWEDRPLSVYRFIDPEGNAFAHRLEAVTDVSVSPTDVFFRDLVVDWWLLPGNVIVEEDRDELEELLVAGQFSEPDLAKVTEATELVYGAHGEILAELAELQRLAGL